MPTPDPIKSQIANTLQALPQEEVAHFVNAAMQPNNANMTSEQLLNLLVADPRIAQLLSNVTQQNQSGGVSLGSGNTIGQMADAVGGDKFEGDKVGDDKIGRDQINNYTNIDLKSLIEFIRETTDKAPPAPAPEPSPHDIEIDNYTVAFSDEINLSFPQNSEYDFPLTFRLLGENGEPIGKDGELIDQLIDRTKLSRKVILRGAAGSGKTTILQRLARLIQKAGYDTILPVYIELRRLKKDVLQPLGQNAEQAVTAESYLEPLLDASIISTLNIDQLKRLGDYTDSKADGMLLVLVDGLNEMYSEEAAGQILKRLELYIKSRSGNSACILVSDRITPRDTSNWRIARIDSIPFSEVYAQFKTRNLDAIYNQLIEQENQLADGDQYNRRLLQRSLLQTAYFLNYALKHNTPVLLSSVAAAMGEFFHELADDMELSDGVLDQMSQAAFDAYKKNRRPQFDVDVFAQAIGQANFDKLDNAGVIIRLPADATAAPGAPAQAQFDHPLQHDYLAARYLSRPDTEWTPESLDAVSFESNSFDALAMTLELLSKESDCDEFIQRVHNWNWIAALVCIAKAMRTGASRHSKEVQLAVLALVAEKIFDPVQQTRKRATEVLALFPQDIATPYKAVHDLPELYALVKQQAQSEAKLQNSEQWYSQWRDLFVRSDGPPFNEQDLKKIVDSKGIIGWTAANVFRRFRMSDIDVRQMRAYYDACAACDYKDWRASTIRSRVVHALGGTDTAASVDLLLEVLSRDPYMWARIGAARSLVEIAALTADADLRGKVIGTLIGMITNPDDKMAPVKRLSELGQLKTLQEIGQAAFYRNAHDGWQQAATPLIESVRGSQSGMEQDWWSKLLADFTAYCQKPAELSVGGTDPQPSAPNSVIAPTQ